MGVLATKLGGPDGIGIGVGVAKVGIPCTMQVFGPCCRVVRWHAVGQRSVTRAGSQSGEGDRGLENKVWWRLSTAEMGLGGGGQVRPG